VRMLVEPLRIEGDADAVTLSLDGAPAAFTATDRHGAELRWPGATPGVTLSFQHRGSPTPSVKSWKGDWAFDRMLHDARLSDVTASGFVATLTDGGATIALRVRMLNSTNPFTLRELGAFQCPTGL
jgi:type VI secretion system protein ImpL